MNENAQILNRIRDGEPAAAEDQIQDGRRLMALHLAPSLEIRDRFLQVARSVVTSLFPFGLPLVGFPRIVDRKVPI